MNKKIQWILALILGCGVILLAVLYIHKLHEPISACQMIFDHLKSAPQNENSAPCIVEVKKVRSEKNACFLTFKNKSDGEITLTAYINSANELTQNNLIARQKIHGTFAAFEEKTIPLSPVIPADSYTTQISCQPSDSYMKEMAQEIHDIEQQNNREFE